MREGEKRSTKGARWERGGAGKQAEMRYVWGRRKKDGDRKKDTYPSKKAGDSQKGTGTSNKQTWDARRGRLSDDDVDVEGRCTSSWYCKVEVDLRPDTHPKIGRVSRRRFAHSYSSIGPPSSILIIVVWRVQDQRTRA